MEVLEWIGMEPKRILVVDDEKTIADTLTAILTHAGYEVRAVYSGLSALEHAREWAPHLIGSDVVMPGMNGIDMAIQMRALFPSCRVLLFSGQAATTDLLADAAAQGDSFELLLKPIHPRDLIAKVCAVLADIPASIRHNPWRLDVQARTA